MRRKVPLPVPSIIKFQSWCIKFKPRCKKYTQVFIYLRMEGPVSKPCEPEVNRRRELYNGRHRETHFWCNSVGELSIGKLFFFWLEFNFTFRKLNFSSKWISELPISSLLDLPMRSITKCLFVRKPLPCRFCKPIKYKSQWN